MTAAALALPERAIVATSRLDGWGGAQVVACEVAEALVQRGLTVQMYAYFVSSELRDHVEALGASVSTQAATFDLASTDLVYSHHQVASRLLYEAAGAGRVTDRLPVFVYNHLSPYDTMEAPGPLLQAQLADVTWCNSAETQAALRRFGTAFQSVDVVPNPAPDRFFAEPTAGPGPLRALLILSNHIPEEMEGAARILTQQGVQVTRIGLGHVEKRVKPEDFARHDAVVSIGKSVQYALAGRVPVYCYDHFGGPGWLTDANFASAALANFSGRSHPERRSPEVIAAEISEGFAAAAAFARGLPEAVRDTWRLGRHVDALLQDAGQRLADPAWLSRRRALAGAPAFRNEVLLEGVVQENLRREMVSRLEHEEERRARNRREMALRLELEEGRRMWDRAELISLPEQEENRLTQRRRDRGFRGRLATLWERGRK
jgi:hypothetical protein